MMKWIKLGKIFDPTEYNLPKGCLEFAQSPQTLIFDNFVRIYFSTREKDETGKYLSHIAFVDLDRSLMEVLKVSNKSVIKLGSLGNFDEHGIFPLNILRDGETIYGYIGGWNRRVSVSVDGSIGLAISEDNGETFKRVGDGPILTASVNEPFLVGDPFGLKIDNIFHIWYIYGVKWILNESTKEKERVYKIGHAYSHDNINFIKTNRNLISDKLNDTECQALPSVLHHNGKYHMVFCYREAIGFRKEINKAYRLGYAYSFDGYEWARDDEKLGLDVSLDGWDSEMLCYPHLFRLDDKIYLLYNGNEFGRKGFGLALLEGEF